MWNLPGPGTEPVSPALAGGFLITGPPQQSLSVLLKSHSHPLQDALPSLSAAEVIRVSEGHGLLQVTAGGCALWPHPLSTCWSLHVTAAHHSSVLGSPLDMSEGLGNHSEIPLPTLMALTMKNLPALEETQVHSLH